MTGKTFKQNHKPQTQRTPGIEVSNESGNTLDTGKNAAANCSETTGNGMNSERAGMADGAGRSSRDGR